MLLQNRFNQIDSQIISVESEIANLQTQLSELQQHRQHLQSVEQACESALTQIDTALAMLNHVDPDCIQTFKAAMMAKFDTTIATLPEAFDTDSTPESEPVNPIEPDTYTITVESIPEAIETETTQESEPRPLTSVGSAAFNPSTADFDSLKAWVRSHQGDDTTRQYGTLTRRSTWEVVARKLLNG